MYTVADALAALETLAPTRWIAQVYPGDNVGLLVGRRNAPLTAALAALDVTLPVVEEALRVGAQLIVAHHPVTFGLKSVTDGDGTGRLFLALLENRLAAICMHTNYDAAPGGVNDHLAQAVGLTDAGEILGAAFRDPDGRAYGLGRVGQLAAPLSAAELAQTVKTALNAPGVRWVDGGRPCRTVAVGSGNSTSQWSDVLRRGCDAFITGDVKYHLFLEAAQQGVTLIDAGHFPTEQLAVPPLAAHLRQSLPGLTVRLSEAGATPENWLSADR
ncbi:MAG: Nif3-like dinuclear metal center hexameric protein [Oscillospiraceae bacterium]|jgi:dinuclear metal center YbgI/SA1388 family protein|nr:Nif3-like dinuclear metal center hexameric protein [Oscillospiraceae bacterium]